VDHSWLCEAAVKIARLTREHPRIRRGASVRAALSVAEIGKVLLDQGKSFVDAFTAAVLLAFPTRIEIEREAEAEKTLHAEVKEILSELLEQALESMGESSSLKKKTS
jgi:hypothetical protein